MFKIRIYIVLFSGRVFEKPVHHWHVTPQVWTPDQEWSNLSTQTPFPPKTDRPHGHWKPAALFSRPSRCAWDPQQSDQTRSFLQRDKPSEPGKGHPAVPHLPQSALQRAGGPGSDDQWGRGTREGRRSFWLPKKTLQPSWGVPSRQETKNRVQTHRLQQKTRPWPAGGSLPSYWPGL